MDCEFETSNFISCFKFVEKNENVGLYRFLENIVFGKLSEQNCKKLSKELTEMGAQKFVEHLKAVINKTTKANIEEKKRKNIRDSMVEDYIISQKKSYKDFQDINLKIFLKKIPTKNIVVENGEITSIKNI